MNASHIRGLSMQFQLDLLRESIDDKTITSHHCQKIAKKIQSTDLPLECRQHAAKPTIKHPTPPTSGNLQNNITVAPKPVVVSPFEGMRGGPGRVYHAQVQRRLTSTRRFSKN